MTMDYFSDLLPVLSDRSKLAAISRLGYANVPLRRHLAELFSRPYGKTGAFLADPTFEATFGWQTAEENMSDLSGSLLTADLVTAMDTPPRELVGDYRFGRDQHPYTHQLESWRILGSTIPQSLVIASGTGSGKTECFMVPILDRLIRQRAEQQGKLSGVRALFLYPLNALINSQRERLRAWTHSFGGDIRFCLYNGNTPETVPTREKSAQPGEVLDRKTLRTSPSPILVTNATMLEYMLVRTADAPILEQSQGKLEWVVLDEAHTYVGSQAAEIALLIRRVLFAFGVAPEDVHFVATSATIGDPNGTGGQSLKRFLADVAGVLPERVHLIAGQRKVPRLDHVKAVAKTPISELVSIDADKETSRHRYDALVENVTARKLRSLFVGDPTKPQVAKLSDVCDVIFGAKKEYTLEQQHEGLRWLDLLSGTCDNTGKGEDDGISFLPLRAHLFHQSLLGLWACADRACVKKYKTGLDDKHWPFGTIYFDPRKHCECGSPVYEIVTCKSCGMVHLLAGEQDGILTHLRTQGAMDEFELEIDTGMEVEADEVEDEQQTGGKQHKVIVVNRELQHTGPLYIQRESRKIIEPSKDTLSVLAHEDDGNGLICPGCNARETPKEPVFQHSRLGAPFLLGGILPTLLEYAPDSEKPADHPGRGRRLLSFNDSRQGTARMAAKLQQDSERNRVRALIYHLALQHGKGHATTQIVKKRNELSALENVPLAARNPALEKMMADMRVELDELAQLVPIDFNELAIQLANQGRDFDFMYKNYHQYAPVTFGEASGTVELAKMFIVREFGRRPKRLNNLESMGLVAVRYPGLQKVAKVPDIVLEASDFDVATWRDFLKICLDYFVRSGGSLAITPDWRNWLGIPFPQNQLVSRDETNIGRTQRRWPRVKRSGRRSGLVRLLAYVLHADINKKIDEDKLDSILVSAWDTLIGMGILQLSGDGRILPLNQLAFSPIGQAWICPVTRRLLDTCLRGVTPYLPENATDTTAMGRQVELPLYDQPFGGVTDDLERIRRGRIWLAENRTISELRDQGIWSVLNDRTIELSLYYTTAEHSAQQDSRSLQRYEKAFKSGDLNLLSCSTTMEMGIDIGGVSMVAMNNVPPHPANYLQRVGRAGRRREARSLGMVLCKSNPHDQAVFKNTRWAFDSILPAPRVSLDSQIIIKRHVHSFLLSRFLARVLTGSGQEQIKLTCGLFFLGEDPISTNFIAWCRGFSPDSSPELEKGLIRLVRYSIYEGSALNRIVDDAADAMEVVSRGWKLEWEQLEREEQGLQQLGENSPALRAVRLHKDRLSKEYLLRELSSRGFLPAYGFPTNIAPFDNLTRGRFLNDKRKMESGREDNRFRRRELASRDLTTALREYAPGSQVVMDGLVYTSAGVTLNWHIPADQQEAREIQNIRFAWRCNQCNSSGSNHSLEAASHCGVCNANIAPANIREFLEPAGFAVDFYKEPTNDITTQHFVPVEAPWINAMESWFPLTNPALGRFRTTTRGHIFHQSRGIYGNGYALCLECGRAEPMSSDDTLPGLFQKPHNRLRKRKEDGFDCSGSDDGWKIKQGITLGHETWTDIFELQIKTEAGVWLNDKTAAMTLAVALRDVLAEMIGVQSNELGCDVKESQPEPGTRCQSILIYDRYAAGYASSADRYINELFDEASKRLDCTADCDSACPHCVLDFDQRFAVDNLDRHVARRIITNTWLKSFRLPDDLAYFGKDSQLESRLLSDAIRHSVSKYYVRAVRIYVGEDFDNWDIGPSPLREFIYRLTGQNIDLEVVLSTNKINRIEDVDRYLLASLADHPRVTIRIMDKIQKSGDGWLIAETLGDHSVRWAASNKTALGFNLDWGGDGGILVKIEKDKPLTVSGSIINADFIRPDNKPGGDRELVIHHELDGPLQGFGVRLWQRLATEHAHTVEIFNNKKDSIKSIVYRDRYLFTPLSIVLLSELVSSFDTVIGESRWPTKNITIVTMNRRESGNNWERNTIWSDWPDTKMRDQVIKHLFSMRGIDATIQLADRGSTGHGRLLEIEWSSGKKQTLRFDQGVSYWRSARSNSRISNNFSLNQSEAEQQAKHLSQLNIKIEGAQLPTQLFLKVR